MPAAPRHVAVVELAGPHHRRGLADADVEELPDKGHEGDDERESADTR